ncbi:MAG: NTP transferase domain-containing protein [Syntrophobacterales bacterium]|jgi:NDP-sugar pyrophosphorylase family protein|nr:NTP transferase domain-containing protein [Syntrophobacterales bacterium]
MRKRRLKTAFILGAGLGIRLRPLTEHCPKPLLPVGGRPAITYAMDHLLEAGVDRFIINTHHCPNVYLEKFPDKKWRGFPIIFRHEAILLDTAGGLKNIEDLIDNDEAILCYNGDVISGMPVRRLMDAHEARRPEATLALRSSGPLLNVNINSRKEVCDLRHTIGHAGDQSCQFSGIYAVETSLLQHIEARKAGSIIPILVKRIVKEPGSVMGIIIDEGEWHDIGSIAQYESLKAKDDI